MVDAKADRVRFINCGDQEKINHERTKACNNQYFDESHDVYASLQNTLRFGIEFGDGVTCNMRPNVRIYSFRCQGFLTPVEHCEQQGMMQESFPGLANPSLSGICRKSIAGLGFNGGQFMANWQSALAAGFFPSPEAKAHDEFTVATEAVRQSLQEKTNAIAAAVSNSSFLEAHKLQQEKLVLEDRLSKLEGAGRVKSDVAKIMRPIQCRSPKATSPIVRAAVGQPRRMSAKTLGQDGIQVIALHLSKDLQ